MRLEEGDRVYCQYRLKVDTGIWDGIGIVSNMEIDSHYGAILEVESARRDHLDRTICSCFCLHDRRIRSWQYPEYTLKKIDEIEAKKYQLLDIYFIPGLELKSFEQCEEDSTVFGFDRY